MLILWVIDYMVLYTLLKRYIFIHAAQIQLKDIHVIFGIGCVLVTVYRLRFFHFEMFPIGSGRIFVSVKINFIFSTIQWCPDYLHDKTDFDI